MTTHFHARGALHGVTVAVLVASCSYPISISRKYNEPDPNGPCLQIVDTHRQLASGRGHVDDTVYKHGADIGLETRDTFEAAFADRPASRARLHRSNALVTAARAVFVLGTLTGVGVTVTSSGGLGSETGRAGFDTVIGSAFVAGVLWALSYNEWGAAINDYNDDARVRGCPLPPP